MASTSPEARQRTVGLKSDQKFSIGQLTRAVSELTGIHCTPAMIYNYEKKGLLDERERTEGGFRQFLLEDVQRVVCIKNLQQEGRSLDEIGEMLLSCPEKYQVLLDDLHLPESRKHKILRAARELFPEEGYDGTTLADVADQAGVSAAAIYQYFDSKEDLFKALIEGFSFRDVLEDILETVEAREIETRFDIRQALIQLARAYIAMHDDNTELFRMFLAETRHFPEIGVKYNRQLVKPLEDLTEKFLALTMEQGLFRPMDPGLAAHAFYGMFLIFHVTQDLLEGREVLTFPEENRVEDLVDLYLQGMLAA
jgi:AcrR family transcriptional regulator